jgi:hypothetical protein
MRARCRVAHLYLLDGGMFRDRLEGSIDVFTQIELYGFCCHLLTAGKSQQCRTQTNVTIHTKTICSSRERH